MERKFITIKQASDILGVSTLTLRNWDKSGKFKALRHPINNYRVYELSEIERLISEMKNANNQRFGKQTKKLEIKHLD